MAKTFLDNTGLSYLINNYIINKRIGTTKGDILYVSSVTSDMPTWARLGIGSNNQILRVSNGVPTWSNETTISVSPTYTTGLNIGSVASNTFYVPYASSTLYGLIKTGYTTANKNYKLEVDSNGNGYVNVPWTDTKYSGQIHFKSSYTEALIFSLQSNVSVTFDTNDFTGVLNSSDLTISINTITTTQIDDMF